MISAPHGFSLGLQKTPKPSILHAGSQNALWECDGNLCCDKADLLFCISGDGASRRPRPVGVLGGVRLGELIGRGFGSTYQLLHPKFTIYGDEK
ncbi:hypothetical protein KUCAC02_003222 [Chaenocephalus aceratus]|uniref:Uncharacterized protein n=1 Tax=Chaenocephalus aceratus TaxID=36190 RepID=A0ACB9WKX2_CHAAC|nr:hypothetical protein KUCAC02_003222 [Chaenocephalus aceratus]